MLLTLIKSFLPMREGAASSNSLRVVIPSGLPSRSCCLAFLLKERLQGFSLLGSGYKGLFQPLEHCEFFFSFTSLSLESENPTPIQ